MLNLEYCKEYFEQVKQFAENNNLLENFNETLSYLDTYAENGERGKTKCSLFKDFAPNSFEFLMERKNESGEYVRWFNGGMIFFQANEYYKNSNWSIHT